MANQLSITDFQTLIGYSDVKSFPVYFYVQKDRRFDKINTPVPFDIETSNVGNAMNLQSGVFTAPRNGIYFFSISGIAHVTSKAHGVFHLKLILNGKYVGNGAADTVGVAYETVSIQSLLVLKVGDRVWLELPRGQVNAYLHDNSNHFTHFTGWMLQEDFSQS